MTGPVPDSRSASEHTTLRHDGNSASPDKTVVQSMFWSVYYHAFHQRTLRGTVLRKGHPFEPIALHKAVAVALTARDARSFERQRRVLTRLAAAGFAYEPRWKLLRQKALEANDPEWQERIELVRTAVFQLAEELGLDTTQLGETPVHRVQRLLERQLALNDPGCTPLEPTLVACQVPVYNDAPRPLTTVVATAVLPKSPIDLARTFDPRSWGTCFEHFQTERKRAFDPKYGNYPQFFPDLDPIGEPWNPADAPHLFWERVTLQSDQQTNEFENILEVTSFSVSPTRARLDFTLHDDWRMKIPGLALDINKCVTVDEGHLEATLLSPSGGNPLSRVELVKRVQFVDLDDQGGNNPLGFDPGEILNYLAPACMCMWLEDLTQGAVCCAA